MLGEGGMGQVYRGRDPRLGREIAIKVLPQDSWHDAEAKARFEREARAVASLSHPNVIAVHDFGEENGTFYVVTELLEGKTLRDRMLEWKKQSGDDFWTPAPPLARLADQGKGFLDK